eukprot:7082975-Prymnesium_polylepis.1
MAVSVDHNSTMRGTMSDLRDLPFPEGPISGLLADAVAHTGALPRLQKETSRLAQWFGCDRSKEFRERASLPSFAE